MKILVLLKAVPDLKALSVSKGQERVFEKAPRVMNPSDRQALEAALQLRETAGGTVAAILPGRAEDERVLRETLAVGGDEAHHILIPEVDGGDSLSHTHLMGSLLRKLAPFDLILCGGASEDNVPAQTGPRLAEFLGIPQATGVRKILSADNGAVEVERLPLDPPSDTPVRISIALPALLTVEEGAFTPRIPNAIRIMKAARIPINPYEADSLEQVPPAAIVRRFYVVE